MSGESFVEEFEDLFLLLLIRVSTNSAIKYLKIAWPRRTVCPRCYFSASRMTNRHFISYLASVTQLSFFTNISIIVGYFLLVSYSAFHKTYDRQFAKFVVNFISPL